MAPKVDSGFVKADSRNLPNISMFTAVEYFASSNKYTAPEIRGVKATLSCRESYGDSAVGYVCLKREGTKCTVQGKICPEHRVRQKDYTVTLCVDEKTDVVEYVQCLDCAASAGGCKHEIAFLMWCNHRCESASPTDVECYWKKSRLSGVGTAEKFITAQDIKDKSALSSKKQLGDNSDFLPEVVSFAKANNLDSQLSRHNFDLTERTITSLSLHQLLIKFSSSNDGSSVEDFIDFAEKEMAENLCKEAEIMTQDQSESSWWHELRHGRITASTVYEASRCKTSEGSLVQRIIGATKVFDTLHMARGRELEPLVLHEVAKKLQIHIESTGLFLIPSFPMLGASPDGMGEDFVVEVKCPSSEANVKTYLSNGQISHKFKGQVHLQMFATKMKKGLFCVAHPDFIDNKEIMHVWVDFDEAFFIKMIFDAVSFWKKNVFPILLQTVSR